VVPGLPYLPRCDVPDYGIAGNYRTASTPPPRPPFGRGLAVSFGLGARYYCICKFVGHPKNFGEAKV